MGTLFNNIVVVRKNAAGAVDQRIKVPIQYGPRSKTLARIEQDPELTRPDSITLPRMSFEITSMHYASERAGTATDRRLARSATSNNNHLATFRGVPYDFNYQLNVYTKNFEDACQIAEQILPFFTPSWTATMRHVDDLDIVLDVPITLVGTSFTDDYDADFTQRRAIVWTFDFVLSGLLIGPVTSRGVIKFATARVSTIEGVNQINVTARPGLTANGSPTTRLAESVPLAAIEESDDWGVIITVADDNTRTP